MKDAALTLIVNFPAAGGSVNTGTLDIGVNIPAFSGNWRMGSLSLTIPALPNNVDPAKIISISLLDSGDGGLTFAPVAAGIVANIPGVATTGSMAAIVDLPLPPGLRGPIQLQVAVPAGVGDCTAASIKGEWQNQD